MVNTFPAVNSILSDGFGFHNVPQHQENQIGVEDLLLGRNIMLYYIQYWKITEIKRIYVGYIMKIL